jgi:hypothetical protein
MLWWGEGRVCRRVTVPRVGVAANGVRRSGGGSVVVSLVLAVCVAGRERQCPEWGGVGAGV